MPLTFLLLQLTNFALAAASLWIHFRNPLMWDDQAIVFSSSAGALSASLTAIILGIQFMFAKETKPASAAINLVLTLGFAALQLYLLFLTGRDLGLMQILKSKFH